MSEDTGHDLAVLAVSDAGGTVAAGPVPVVSAPRLRDATLVYAPSAACAVLQGTPVQPNQPGRDPLSGGSRFPSGGLIELVKRRAGVRVGAEPPLHVRRDAALPRSGVRKRRALGACRVAHEQGESGLNRLRCLL